MAKKKTGVETQFYTKRNEKYHYQVWVEIKEDTHSAEDKPSLFFLFSFASTVQDSTFHAWKNVHHIPQ